LKAIMPKQTTAITNTYTSCLICARAANNKQPKKCTLCTHSSTHSQTVANNGLVGCKIIW
jgi:hypothetical protein